jgi:redox-regulated HSP33 family molecular chaperone
MTGHVTQSWAIDIIHRFGFKPVEGGFIYRAPKSGLFASAEQYLVTSEQRDAIVTLLVSDRPKTGLETRAVAVGLGALALAALPATLLPDYADAARVLGLEILVLLMISEHFLTRRKLARLQPVLSTALKVVP